MSTSYIIIALTMTSLYCDHIVFALCCESRVSVPFATILVRLLSPFFLHVSHVLALPPIFIMQVSLIFQFIVYFAPGHWLIVRHRPNYYVLRLVP